MPSDQVPEEPPKASGFPKVAGFIVAMVLVALVVYLLFNGVSAKETRKLDSRISKVETDVSALQASNTALEKVVNNLGTSKAKVNPTPPTRKKTAKKRRRKSDQAIR